MSHEIISKHYERCFDKYGDNHKGVDWPNEEDLHTRYDVMLNIIKDVPKKDKVTILDFGCGCGHLLEYIQQKKINIEYSGLDISEKYVNYCKSKYPYHTFYKIDVLKEQIDELPNFDYIILNGVFTEKRELTEDEMFNFFTSVLKIIFNKTKIGLSFNVMCPIVDFKRSDLFYLSYDKLGIFLKEYLSRHYIINNNYKLWEYTTYVYK